MSPNGKPLVCQWHAICLRTPSHMFADRRLNVYRYQAAILLPMGSYEWAHLDVGFACRSLQRERERQRQRERSYKERNQFRSISSVREVISLYSHILQRTMTQTWRRPNHNYPDARSWKHPGIRENNQTSLRIQKYMWIKSPVGGRITKWFMSLL